MPSVVHPRGFRVQTLDPTAPKGFKVAVTSRVGKALRPEVFKQGIPDRVTLSEQAPPFAGEIREEQFGRLRNPLAPSGSAGGQQVLATLRRAWNFVGFSVDPGDSAHGITAELRVLVRGMEAFLPASLLVIAPGVVTASLAFQVACRCELVVFGEVADGQASPVNGVRGTIWGMSQH